MIRLSILIILFLLLGCSEQSFNVQKIKVVETEWRNNIDIQLENSADFHALNQWLTDNGAITNFDLLSNFDVLSAELARITSENDPMCYTSINLSVNVNKEKLVLDYKIKSIGICHYRKNT